MIVFFTFRRYYKFLLCRDIPGSRHLQRLQGHNQIGFFQRLEENESEHGNQVTQPVNQLIGGTFTVLGVVRETSHDSNGTPIIESDHSVERLGVELTRELGSNDLILNVSEESTVVDKVENAHL